MFPGYAVADDVGKQVYDPCYLKMWASTFVYIMEWNAKVKGLPVGLQRSVAGVWQGLSGLCPQASTRAGGGLSQAVLSG